jgi:hypothetical protein
MNVDRGQMRAKMRPYREGIKTMREARLGKMNACLERKEPTPEEVAKIAEHPEDSNEATGEETIGTTRDQSRDRYLAVRSSGTPTKLIQGDDGPGRIWTSPAFGRSASL